jgi:hypothetical protein
MSTDEAAAFNSGGVAFRAGLSRDANPHPAQDIYQFAWMIGWVMAKLHAATVKGNSCESRKQHAS